MKKISEIFINMVYPMLISFFIFCFVEAFVKTNCETLELTSCLFSIFFGTLFVIGLVLTIVGACINKRKNNSHN